MSSEMNSAAQQRGLRFWLAISGVSIASAQALVIFSTSLNGYVAIALMIGVASPLLIAISAGLVLLVCELIWCMRPGIRTLVLACTLAFRRLPLRGRNQGR